MDYFCLIQSAVAYIESRVHGDVDPVRISQSMGVSVSHFRDVFRKRTGVSLAEYILCRRVSNASFELVHTDRKILDVALDYGFYNPDTFTRAFTRFTGMTPSKFRKSGIGVGRIKLTAGAYGPGIRKADTNPMACSFEEERMLRTEKTVDGCVLYGVQKVQYCYEECTPFPAVLRSCLNYMGQEIRYGYLMAVTGAAFRLRWNPSSWDGGNVDIMNIYEGREEAFIRGFRAAGRTWRFLWRTPETKKEEYIRFITAEIDAGRPVIALGIIGPPEAAIVCGYRNGGQTLLGWNFFQENPEFAGDSKIDESGYFICDSWWDNPESRLLMAIGEGQDPGIGSREILENALMIMTDERVGDYVGGQKAYEAWALAMANDGDFSDGMPLPRLFERMMCQTDAMTMVGEGRAYAACFMREVADRFRERCKESLSELASKAARSFDGEFHLVQEMMNLPGCDAPGEAQARFLAKAETRKELVMRINHARVFDHEAADAIRDLLGRWEE